MQEEEKTVDIDTSGPDTEVELNQEEQSPDTTTVESIEEAALNQWSPLRKIRLMKMKEKPNLIKKKIKQRKKKKKDELKEEYSEEF